MTLQEINIKLITPLNFLEYNSIISALKKYTNKYSNLKSFKEVTQPPALNQIMSKEKGSSHIYKKMIIAEKDITGFNRWSKITSFSKEEWHKSFFYFKNNYL